jgi:3-polyprenyl-4-hydroxybenzoate decarboxylase
VIFPTVPAYYAKPQTLDELVTDLAGRILLRFGIENDDFSQWKGD